MQKFLLVDDIVAAQTPSVVNAFKSILFKFDTIIEIGFNRGAFTLWLFRNKKENTKLVSYDITFNQKEVCNNEIDFRQGDCFSEPIIDEIQNLILLGGKTLVLCDGGAKEKEFILYSQFLKSGDVIMCHDYADTHEEFFSISRALNWNSGPESSFDNIKSAVELNNLEKFEYDLFKNVLWGAFSKK